MYMRVRRMLIWSKDVIVKLISKPKKADEKRNESKE